MCVCVCVCVYVHVYLFIYIHPYERIHIFLNFNFNSIVFDLSVSDLSIIVPDVDGRDNFLIHEAETKMTDHGRALALFDHHLLSLYPSFLIFRPISLFSYISPPRGFCDTRRSDYTFAL